MGDVNNLDTGERVAIAIREQPVHWAKWIAIILTVVSLVVGAVVWASTEHSDIRVWTADQDYATKQDLEETAEKLYVPKEEFSRVEQSVKDIKGNVKETKEKVDKIYDIILTRKK
jgi:septal ring factor EnvC (AmiA/AmiB activator)